MFPVGHAFIMAMSIGHVSIIPSGTASSALVPLKQSEQSAQGKDSQSQGSSHCDDHIQQEVLVGGHLVYGGAQVVGTVVTEDVADPVGSSGDGMAWLVFVNVGENTCLLAVPTQEDRGNENTERQDTGHSSHIGQIFI